MIKFTYHGEAVGKGRPRVSRRGNYVHTYTPEKTRAFEEAVRFEFMASNSDKMPVYERETPLKAKVIIGVSIPKSYSKKKQALCRDRVLVPDKKPDIDNILKAIFDSLNGYAFADDVQIVQVYAEKQYAVEPFVEVEIDELR
jgi:Holliday junction resolvase RusA-like endonuclease